MFYISYIKDGLYYEVLRQAKDIHFMISDKTTKKSLNFVIGHFSWN